MIPTFRSNSEVVRIYPDVWWQKGKSREFLVVQSMPDPRSSLRVLSSSHSMSRRYWNIETQLTFFHHPCCLTYQFPRLNPRFWLKSPTLSLLWRFWSFTLFPGHNQQKYRDSDRRIPWQFPDLETHPSNEFMSTCATYVYSMYMCICIISIIYIYNIIYL